MYFSPNTLAPQRVFVVYVYQLCFLCITRERNCSYNGRKKVEVMMNRRQGQNFSVAYSLREDIMFSDAVKIMKTSICSFVVEYLHSIIHVILPHMLRNMKGERNY